MSLRARIRRDEAGIGIVEMVIAIAVINIAIMAMFAMFNAGALTILRAARTSNAAVVAEKQMELYRGMLYAEIRLNSSLVTTDTTVSASPLVTTQDSTHTGATEWVSAATQVSASACTSTNTECKPVQSPVTGPDGRSYRIDTYVTATSVSSGRNGKQVTVIVRLAPGTTSATSKVLAKLTSNFDLATGCIVGSATAGYAC